MENLFGQVGDYLGRNLAALALHAEAYEFGHWHCQVVLIVKQVDDFLDVLGKHVFELGAILRHALLQNVKKQILARFKLVVLLNCSQHVESRLQVGLHELLVNLAVWPQQVYWLLKHCLVHQLDYILGRHQN